MDDLHQLRLALQRPHPLVLAHSLLSVGHVQAEVVIIDSICFAVHSAVSHHRLVVRR